MAFLRGAWRILVGVKDALVLLFLLLFFGLLYMALSFSSKPQEAAVSTGALLLKLDGVIVEQPAEVDPVSLLSGPAPDVHEYRLRDVVTALEAAKSDDKIKAVVLDLDGFMGGEIGRAHV